MTVGSGQEVAAAKKSRAYLYVIIFCLTVFIIYLIPFWYTSNPISCTRCHQMQPYYDSWQKSVHQRAVHNCFDCHVSQGKVALAVYRLSFYREIYASYAGQKLKPLNAKIPTVSSCHRSGCHSLNRMSSISGDIKIDHKNHVKNAKVVCIKCHPGVAHPNGSVIPSRSLCFTCHEAQKNDCKMCHTKEAPGGGHY